MTMSLHGEETTPVVQQTIGVLLAVTVLNLMTLASFLEHRLFLRLSPSSSMAEVYRQLDGRWTDVSRDSRTWD